MGLLTKEVTLKWSGYIKNLYINKGYLFTSNGDEFIVKIEDVPPQSHIWVDCKCDICGEVFQKQYYSYYKSINNGGIIRCDNCKSLKHKKKDTKYLYKDVKLKCEELGFELISKETGAVNDYVQVRCYKHYDILQTKRMGDIFRNRGCKYCRIDNDRHSYDYVKSLFEEKGCTLLSKTYVNSNLDLEFICNKHYFETQVTTASEIKQCQPCKYCQSEEQSQRQSHSIEFIQEYFKSKNCELISVDYKNNNTPLNYICSNHKEKGIQTTTFHTFRLSHGCPFCSLEFRSGENHPLYNPNLTEEDRIKGREIFGYTEWRKSVYKRDNWTCQICGLHNGKIHAHHLFGYTENPDKRLEINNGVTLCPNCHIEFHIKYTKINNTPQQYEEFKKLKQEQLKHNVKEVI